MSDMQTAAVQRWQMKDISRRDRLDFWVAAVNSTLIPLYVNRADAATFEFEMAAAQLGPVSVVRQRASAHHCGRGRSELSRSGDCSFNLLMSLDSNYGIVHRGDLGMKAGDVALHFSEYPIDLAFRTDFNFVNLTLPENWLRTWLPNPQSLVGRRITVDSPWGLALSTFLKALSPDYVAQAPVPGPVLLDQLGVLLSLAATGSGVGGTESSRAERSLQERVCDLIEQRCHERNLTAEQVGQALGVSSRTIHRALAAGGHTFGRLLIEARVACATRMLQSPAFDRLTVAEIGRRSGFSNPSHFARAVRDGMGRTPRQLRAQRTQVAVIETLRPVP